MSLDQNKSTVHAYVDAFNHARWDQLKSLFTEDATIHGVLGWGGLDVAMPIWKDLHHAFGIHLTVDAIAAEGDAVSVRYTERGTFNNAFRGSEPTGKSYEVVAMEWFDMKDGRIARRWGARDSANIFRQLGIKIS